LHQEGRQVAKKRVGKFPKAFRQYEVALLKQCDNIVELSKELSVIGGCCISGAISSNRRTVVRGHRRTPVRRRSAKGSTG
jgi:hypothetical protein